MAEVSPARAAAFHVLMTVERGTAHADELLRGKRVRALAGADRNLATALVLGVLRWQLRLDHEIKALLARPNAKLDDEIHIALRLGAYQLRHMDRIPARAAIGDSVELAKQAGHHYAARMVNAVLRKLADATHEVLPEATPAELARAAAHPVWMVERWAEFYGMDAARKICTHGQSQPAQSLRIVSAEAEAQLAGAGVVLDAGALLTAARRVIAGDVTATAAFHDGRVRLQDEGSQLVAEVGGHGSVILDACAAPGGKTLILAELNPMARIAACEANAQRMERLKERLVNLGGRVDFRLGDAAELREEKAYDLVLADVPCSGTGTLGRNPEIRHRLHLEDLARQSDRQRAILRAALRAARPGGRVVYSTCSLEPEENEQVVRAVLAENAQLRVVPITERVAAMRAEGVVTDAGAERLAACATDEGFLQLLPGRLGTDGFFVALLEKRAG